MPLPVKTPPFLGLRTAIVHVGDLARAKAWYQAIFDVAPYFDEPFYVGFDVGGFELGLNPDTSVVPAGASGVVVYWGVADARAAWSRVLALGAEAFEEVKDVGGGILVATVKDPFGNLLGIIENPNFKGPR